jgi:deazaflavin-dependent oxidoreductase (nitroreductase family)
MTTKPNETDRRNLQNELTDSPVKWVSDHVRRYIESDGKTGHRWSGMDTLLITTRGRKTGLLRRTALIYGRDRDRYIVVASNGGKPRHPAWYLNLLQNPEVQVQVGSEKFEARARPATDEERPRLWALMTSIFSTYENFREKTSREIPVVILERI